MHYMQYLSVHVCPSVFKVTVTFTPLFTNNVLSLNVQFVMRLHLK